MDMLPISLQCSVIAGSKAQGMEERVLTVHMGMQRRRKVKWEVKTQYHKEKYVPHPGLKKS